MGITGLLPFLEKASSAVHLKNLQGTTVAVDTYCWLHKGTFACAEKLARGEDCTQYLTYCLKYVELLLSFNIKPILVFDGGHLPAKELTEKRRRDSRKESKQRAIELLRLGKTEEARSHLRRCINVTHEMALNLIKECRQRNVDCIVAPYEADAQMAWLNKVNLAEYVITEDSDLTLFGARKIIFKLDLTGAGRLVEADKLHLAMGCSEEKYDLERFRRMCILSGCDYLDSLPGIGLAKACKFMLKTEEDDMWRALKKLPQYLNMKNLEVSDEYIEGFLKADATFKHMYIYNPLKRCMERLNALEDYQTDERYCSNAGKQLEDNETAFQLALGNVNPFTLKQLDNWHPDRNFGFAQAVPKHIKRAKHRSIWNCNTQLADSSHTATKKVNQSVALFFKKVDCMGKSVDEEISANLQAEKAKPEEADIFSMYKTEVNVSNAQMKRKRNESTSSTSSLDNSKSPPASPLPMRARHNPFAKVAGSVEEQAPVVCGNSSLLKVLSPRKCNELLRQSMASGAGSIKRSLFSAKETHTIEVKSRFFATNIKEVNESQQIVPDLSKVNDKRAQQLRDNQAFLYHSPSPKKQLKSSKFEELKLSNADSGIESLATNNTEDDDAIDVAPNCDIESLATNNTEDDDAIDVAPNKVEVDNTAEELEPAEVGSFESEMHTVNSRRSSTENEDNVITLSDSEEAACSKKLAQFAAVTTRAPRVGLSRKISRKNSKLKTTKSSTKLNKAISSNDLGATQTRLSMFGFQKRPMLK